MDGDDHDDDGEGGDEGGQMTSRTNSHEFRMQFSIFQILFTFIISLSLTFMLVR